MAISSLFILVVVLSLYFYVIKFGQGGKRFAIGTGIILFTLLAIASYGLSMNSGMTMFAIWNGQAATGVRKVFEAEWDFKNAALLDANHNGVGEFGTLEQLIGAGLIDSGIEERYGVRLTIDLSNDPLRNEKEFFVCGTPMHYRPPKGSGWFLLPGHSLWWALHPPQRSSWDTFALDETGVIRRRDLGTSRPVTREEVQNWPEF